MQVKQGFRPTEPEPESGAGAAITTNDASFGEYELSELAWYLWQLEAAAGPTWDEWDSCVGRWYY